MTLSDLRPARRALPLALLALVWCAGGCGRRETPVEAGNRAQILHRGIGNEVTELDPHLVTGVAVPVLALGAWLALQRAHRRIAADDGEASRSFH